MNKMNKAELLKEMKRLEERYKTAEDVDVRHRYKQRHKRARRHFYECRICGDAVIEPYINKKGDERERFIRDCGLEACPYHDYFVDLANGIEDDVTKGLKIFLSRY